MPDILTIFHLLSYCRIFGLNLSVALRLQIGSLSEADLPAISLKGGRKGTTAPKLLTFSPKNQIPIRTFSEWKEEKPGFLEMNLLSSVSDFEEQSPEMG